MEIVHISSSLSVRKVHYFSSVKSLRKFPKFTSVCCRASYNETNFYKLLSLSSSNADIEEIRRAYRTLALKYHPDVCPPSTKENCTKMFIELHEAYRTLSDPVLREEYNYEMGLNKLENRAKMVDGRVYVGRSRWEDQLIVLRKKSNENAGQKDGSWGARLRAKNRQNSVV